MRLPNSSCNISAIFLCIYLLQCILMDNIKGLWEPIVLLTLTFRLSAGASPSIVSCFYLPAFYFFTPFSSNLSLCLLRNILMTSISPRKVTALLLPTAGAIIGTFSFRSYWILKLILRHRLTHSEHLLLTLPSIDLVVVLPFWFVKHWYARSGKSIYSTGTLYSVVCSASCCHRQCFLHWRDTCWNHKTIWLLSCQRQPWLLIFSLFQTTFAALLWGIDRSSPRSWPVASSYRKSVFYIHHTFQIRIATTHGKKLFW